uniref:Uncharacterized protein n=1 Tax=Knipowitschia caucasica TaxID=637954 RepID=A0AAV2JP54_KNICA
MGQGTHTQVELQPGGAIMSVPLMENSPRPGRARHELNRSPSLCRTGTAGGLCGKEDWVERGKMMDNWFLEQPYRNYLVLDKEEAQAALQTDGPKHYIHNSVTLPTPRLLCRDHGPVGGNSSLPRAVLRRPCQGQGTLDRRTMSMYGEPAKHKQEAKPLEPQPRLRRPRSVCMLAPGPLQPEVRQPTSRQSTVEAVQLRTRRAELRAVDGLGALPASRPLLPPEVTPRVRGRSWRPRPVSMTVLELRKQGFEDDSDSHRGAGRTLPTPNEKVDDGTMQYIKYHSMGKVKVMEVPLCPSKLSKSTQEEPSIWQLITSRFRRKEQTNSGKCEVQQCQSKSSSQFSPGRNNGPQSVTIETLADISSRKGQEWTLPPPAQLCTGIRERASWGCREETGGLES